MTCLNQTRWKGPEGEFFRRAFDGELSPRTRKALKAGLEQSLHKSDSDDTYLRRCCDSCITWTVWNPLCRKYGFTELCGLPQQVYTRKEDTGDFALLQSVLSWVIFGPPASRSSVLKDLL